MPGSRLAVAACLAAAIVASAACETAVDGAASPVPTSSAPSSPATPDLATPIPTDPAASACALPREHLRRVWRGVRIGPSGNVQTIPLAPNYLGAGFSHAGPWDYVQDVPLLVYGPGYVRPAGRIDRVARLVDIAPTQAELLGSGFRAPDGVVLEDALLPRDARPEPPRLVVTLVWDGGGRNVLDTWSDAWPNLRSLIPRGAWYERAVIGSSPSNTPPTHASIGTGAWPMRHGVVDTYQLVDGAIVKPLDTGPDVVRLPTLADVYDTEMGNAPVVGLVATLAAHAAMMSHGAAWPGGDEDLAVVRESEDAETAGAEGLRWALTEAMAPWFAIPSYVNDVADLAESVEELDRADGELDGRWRDHPFSQLQEGFQSPARVPYQMRLVREFVLREGFGRDEVPDLLFVNIKAVDAVGHLYSLNSDEMAETVRITDETLPEMLTLFDEVAGEGRWVMFLTADHGAQFDPAVSGAFQIGIRGLTAYLEDRFGGTPDAPIVTRVRPTQAWIDEENLEAQGWTLDDVATAVLEATQADTADPGVDPPDPGARVFSAAFPTASMAELPCADEAFGG